MGINMQDREKRIQEMMAQFGLTRGEAELAVAVELGEIDGDVIEDDKPDTGNAESTQHRQ